MRAAPTGMMGGHSLTHPSPILPLETRGRIPGAELCPPKSPQNGTVFGDGVFKELMR